MEQKSIKKNTIYNAIKTFSSIIFPLVTFPYISRVLTPENVGKVNFGLSIVSYFSLIASLGITTYAIRACSAVKNDSYKLSNTASQIFSINIITMIIAYMALGGILISIRKLDDYRTLITIQSLSIFATTLGADWLNSAMEDFKYITLRTVTFQLISIFLMFILVKEPDDYMKYAVISLISSAGANFLNIWYRRRYCNVGFIVKIKQDIDWKQHMIPILYLFAMILAQTVYTNVDTTMLGLMIGDKEVGIYSTANKAANTLFQVIISIAWVVMPRMSALFAEAQYDQINKLLRKVFGFYMLLGVPCLVGAFMLSSDIITIIAGAEYEGADIVLRILVSGFVFNLFGASFWGNIVLLPSNREKTYMQICCITAVINIVMNYMFIPLFGHSAAATTTSFCNIVMFIMFLITKDKKIKIRRVKNSIITTLIGSVIIVIICLLASKITYLWIRVITSIFISVIGYVIVQWIGKNEFYIEGMEFVLKRLKN